MKWGTNNFKDGLRKIMFIYCYDCDYDYDDDYHHD